MTTTLASLLRDHQQPLLAQWQQELLEGTAALRGRVPQEDVARSAREFLDLLVDGMASGNLDARTGGMERFFADFSRERVMQGFNSDETAQFLFSIKKPVFALLQQHHGKDAETFAAQAWEATRLLDNLGLRSIRAYQKTREDVIERQQQELLELSTPVVKLWDDVLALPIIGTLDSARTQVMMESLLTRIAETEAAIAIIDITGVPTVDTLVAQHLIKTVTAIRLMGAECIISGVRPQIAQTIVHLGVDLGNVTTKANLADALSLALQRTGVTVTRKPR